MLQSDNFQRQPVTRYLSMSAIMVFATVFAALIMLPGGKSFADGFDQDMDKLSRFIQSADVSEAAAKVFGEARDLLKYREWARAERRFNDFIASYPQDKNVDAAIYYLALALKSQNKFQAADDTLARLMENHPQSNWVDDARAMQVEIAPKLNNNQAIEQGIAANNEEIRLAALQSLFEADSERAVAIVADLLKPGSTASRLMKESAITLLGESDSKQAASILTSVARNESDPMLRRRAIEAMGELDDESALDVLKEIATTSADRDTARAAMEAISEHNSPRARGLILEIARSNADMELRSAAISQLGDYDDDATADELMKLFESEKNERIHREILSALSDMDNARAHAKILEIARSATDRELRRAAISALGDQDDEKAIDGLIQLYDSEKDEEMKEYIISSLGDSDEKKALRKIMDIVRRDPSINLRKKALSVLGDSDDPEVIKFLEEILKKN